MPSFLQMYTATGVGMDNIMQRWWLEPKYESVLRSPDGLAWEFNGASVKCMTEEDFATANGQREHAGKPNAVAQKWADNMTRHYDELAVAEPVFGELRNCMQLALVGALVAHERLADKAGCDLPALMQESTLKTLELPAPTQVDSRVSMVKQGHNWIISVFRRRQHPPRRDRQPGPREFRSRRGPRQGPRCRKVQLVLELRALSSLRQFSPRRVVLPELARKSFPDPGSILPTGGFCPNLPKTISAPPSKSPCQRVVFLPELARSIPILPSN